MSLQWFQRGFDTMDDDLNVPLAPPAGSEDGEILQDPPPLIPAVPVLAALGPAVLDPAAPAAVVDTPNAEDPPAEETPVLSLEEQLEQGRAKIARLERQNEVLQQTVLRVSTDQQEAMMKSDENLAARLASEEARGELLDSMRASAIKVGDAMDAMMAVGNKRPLPGPSATAPAKRPSYAAAARTAPRPTPGAGPSRPTPGAGPSRPGGSAPQGGAVKKKGIHPKYANDPRTQEYLGAGKCFICSKHGHKALDCPMRSAEGAPPSTK